MCQPIIEPHFINGPVKGKPRMRTDENSFKAHQKRYLRMRTGNISFMAQQMRDLHYKSRLWWAIIEN